MLNSSTAARPPLTSASVYNDNSTKSPSSATSTASFMSARMASESRNVTKLRGTECRLVVVGKTGSGKSSLVNSLMGEDLAEISVFGQSLTKDTKFYIRPRFHKELRVVDTPGLFDNRPEMTNEVILHKLAQTALLLAPGPHAMLLTLRCGDRYTAEEQAVVTHLRDFFGKEILKHTIVVFTRGDELETQKARIEDYVENAPPQLKDLLNDVGSRYVVINNVTSNRQQRDDNARVLLDLVEKMTRLAKEPYYSSELFCQAEERMGLLDEGVARQYRPRSDSRDSEDKKDKLTDSESRKLIQSIVKEDKDIAVETNVPTAEELAGQDRADLVELAMTLVRLVGCKRVCAGKEEDVVRSMLRTHIMETLDALEELDNVDGGEVTSKNVTKECK